MDVLAIASCLAIGGLAGFLGSILGIGGGIIIVPFLGFLFSFLGFPENHIMQMAIATSLSAMVINTSSSIYFHHRKQTVVWNILVRFVLGIGIGCFIGTWIAKELSSDSLQRIFGVFACIIGFFFLKPHRVSPETKQFPGVLGCSLLGFFVASISSLLGLGGGFFMFPIFLHFHFSGPKAAGTSSATSFLMSVGGALSYLISSAKAPIVPKCFGYVYIPAFFALSISCFLGSFYGVKIGSALSIQKVRRIFALTLVSVGLIMFFLV